MAIFGKKKKAAKATTTEQRPCTDAATFNFMTAIEAHVRWKIRLEAYIDGTSTEQLDADVICKDDQCPLGKWIYSSGKDRYGDHEGFIDLRETHAKFHQSAGDVVRLVDQGKHKEATQLLCSGDYAKHSHRIKSDLARLSLELEI